jgi:hypothetical protein
VLSAQAPDLHQALQQVAGAGWVYIVLDGALIESDRCAQTKTSAKGQTIDAWYSGKHRRPGGNVQAFIRPDGVPAWISDVMPRHLHDLSCAEQQQILAAACWAASQMDLPTLADSGYEGAGQGIPYKQPANGRYLAVDNRTYNALLRAKRAPGERGFALLKGRWKVLRHVTASPTTISDIARGALVLATFLHDRQNGTQPWAGGTSSATAG